jgi:hypothetical protein
MPADLAEAKLTLLRNAGGFADGVRCCGYLPQLDRIAVAIELAAGRVNVSA